VKAGRASIAGSSGLSLGTDGTIYVALGTDGQGAPTLIRLSRSIETRLIPERLVHRTGRRLQRDADRPFDKAAGI
jgi:hypothetical protein